MLIKQLSTRERMTILYNTRESHFQTELKVIRSEGVLNLFSLKTIQSRNIFYYTPFINLHQYKTKFCIYSTSILRVYINIHTPPPHPVVCSNVVFHHYYCSDSILLPCILYYVYSSCSILLTSTQLAY